MLTTVPAEPSLRFLDFVTRWTTGISHCWGVGFRAGGRVPCQAPGASTPKSPCELDEHELAFPQGKFNLAVRTLAFLGSLPSVESQCSKRILSDHSKCESRLVLFESWKFWIYISSAVLCLASCIFSLCTQKIILTADSRERLCKLMEHFNHLPFSANSSVLQMSEASASPDSSVSSGQHFSILPWVSPPCTAHCKMRPGRKLGQWWRSPHSSVSLLLGITLLCLPIPEKSYFMSFI